MRKKHLMIDLFSGCGGLSYGFEQAGFDCVIGVDHDEAALETFGHNHPHAIPMKLDLSEDDSIKEIVKALGNTKINLIVGGPPCQGFSLTGPRNEDDSRNKLFYSIFKLAKRLSPEFLVIENVPGIANLYGGRARNAIIEEFEKLNYVTHEKLLYAPDYGIPQIRKRMFYVGVKRSYSFSFPEPTHDSKSYVSCEQAIGDLPCFKSDLGSEIAEYTTKPTTDYQKQMRDGSNELFNHVGTKHTDHVVSVIQQVPEGGNHKDLPPGVGESRKFNEAWTRYHSKKPSRTIDTGHRNHFHYKYDRVPTVRENARLQSFPDKFQFLGSKTQQYKQVGNAVPPLLGFHLGKVILDLLEE
ncbi:DNA cytosine methyltransferase [Thalassotalea sp. PS06]|uniref:DNA cytosine methyltransferase n=1 Tax=Thalassotalea sp. PS06 TaxID=2594005 RepID=UPI001C8F3AB4|nr:DNA cytosine methyltransferase [Thalassotalea sp. PS06]